MEQVLAAGGFRGGLTESHGGVTIHGRASDALDSLARTLGLGWSIQGGQLQFTRGREPVPGYAPVISPTTGLVGSPEHGAPDKKGGPPLLKLKCLLLHSIVPGASVVVKSANVNGTFRVESVEHSGDSHGGDWYSSLEVQGT
jgi:hypothetical protein